MHTLRFVWLSHYIWNSCVSLDILIAHNCSRPLFSFSMFSGFFFTVYSFVQWGKPWTSGDVTHSSLVRWDKFNDYDVTEVHYLNCKIHEPWIKGSGPWVGLQVLLLMQCGLISKTICNFQFFVLLDCLIFLYSKTHLLLKFYR